MKKPGLFTVSIDLELAWGVCDKPIQASTHRALRFERGIVHRILSLFSKYNIRATWAVVGHLLLTECDWGSEWVHPEISRPVIKDHSRDWFFQHPESYDDPLWYGRDIVDWIREASPEQEIGSHSFCHMPYDEGSTERDAVRTDIEMAKKLHAAFDLPFEAFVFPRNLVGHRDLLSGAGVSVYRGTLPRWYHSMPFTSLRRLLNLVDFLIPFPPRTAKATVDETGMVNVPESMLLLGRNGLRKLVHSKCIIAKAVAGLNRAARRAEVFHLWFHPSNFAYETDKQFNILETILKHARLLRERGQLEVLTMGDIRKRTAGSGLVSNNTLDEKRSHDNAHTVDGVLVH